MAFFDNATDAIVTGLTRAVDLAASPEILPFTLGALMIVGAAAMRMKSTAVTARA